MDDYHREHKKSADGYNNLILPPLNGSNGHVRGLTSDFIPTTNSSSNWNNVDGSGKQGYERQYQENPIHMSGLSRTSEPNSEQNI